MTKIEIDENSSGIDYSFSFKAISETELFTAIKKATHILSIVKNDAQFDVCYGQYQTVSFIYEGVDYLWTCFAQSSEISFFCTKEDKIINHSVNSFYSEVIHSCADGQVELFPGVANELIVWTNKE